MFAIKALAPTAVLPCPVVLAPKAASPTATLLPAVVFASKAKAPTAVFEDPVFSLSASCPTAIRYTVQLCLSLKLHNQLLYYNLRWCC